MAFAKLSDDFSDDCWTLSDAAYRLHTEGLVWSARKLLDCRVPTDDLRRFARRPEAVLELLAAGWWSLDGDVYVIRHHAQYQRLREDVLAQQAVNIANGRRGGRPRKPRREQASEITNGRPKTESVSETRTEMEGKGQDQEVLQDHRRELDDDTSEHPPDCDCEPCWRAAWDRDGAGA